MSEHDHDTTEASRQATRTAMERLLDRPLAPGDLERQTTAVARPATEATGTGSGVLVFGLGDERLALPAQDVVRVTHTVLIHRVPHRPNPIFRGMCNVDGDLVLCASLRQLLELPAPHTSSDGEGPKPEAARMIVIGAPADRWVFSVDQVFGVWSVTEEQRRPAPMTVELASTTCTECIVTSGDVDATLLETTRVIAGFGGALS